MSRPITLKDPNSLGLHALLKTQPWMCAEELDALRASIRDSGVLQPLFITADGDVVDGRHRWKAARLEHVREVPCIVVPDEEVATIVLATILDRRHYTKSARAYLSLPLLEKAVSEGIQRKSSQLRRGANSPKADSIGFRENGAAPTHQKKGTDELAVRLGISPDMLQLARNTERLFTESDKLVEAWKAKNSELAAEMVAWVDDRPSVLLPWTSWRDDKLKGLGHDPRDPESVRIIPESYREIYEDLLFSGEMGLGAINKAVGSALATKGKGRSDLDKENPGLHITLSNKLSSFTKTMFGASWKELSAEHRLTLATNVADSMEQWPDEAQRAAYQKLKTLFTK